MKIHINDINAFKTFLLALVKFVPSAEFNINKKFTKVLAANEGKIIRGFFFTNSLILDKDVDRESITFSLSEVLKLSKIINLLTTQSDKIEFDLDFDGTFIKFNESTAFKLRTVKNDVITKYITIPLKTELKEVYKFKTSAEKVRKVIQASNIIMNDENKVYFSKKNKSIIAEIDNKSLQFNDSIGLPISDDVEGDVSTVVSTRLQDFSSFALLPTDTVKVMFTKQNVFQVDSELKLDTGNWIKSKLIIPILKG